MDQLLEVSNVKNEPTESTSSDRLEISSETQTESVKQDSNCSVQSEIVIKTEPLEIGAEFSKIASTSYDLCPSYDMKFETDEPMIKTEFKYVIDELLQDPLDVGDEIKVEKHFSIDFDQDGSKIKTEPTEEEKDENFLEFDENSESHGSASNLSDQLLIRNDPDGKYKKHICNECNKMFIKKCNFDRHLRIHTDEKPYTCGVCMTSFKQKGQLNTHMLVHSGGKPHICDLCKEVFKDKSALNEHKLIHSVGEKSFSCDVCYKSFINKTKLSRHKKIHLDIKPYECNMCDKAFIEKSSLIKHTNTHVREKLFSCDVCNKSYMYKSSLDRHKKIHKK